jgi:hypothetical protein
MSLCLEDHSVTQSDIGNITELQYIAEAFAEELPPFLNLQLLFIFQIILILIILFFSLLDVFDSGVK